MPAPATRLSAIPAVLLVVVAIWEIVATRCQATGTPGDDEWAQAAALVRREYKAGDLIVFAPQWADPIGRLHLGDLIPLEAAGRMDADRYGRIWEVSIRGAVARDVPRIPPAVEHLGPVTVRRYERAPATVVGDLVDMPGVRADLVEVAFEPHRCMMLSVPPDGMRFVVKDMPLGTQLVGYIGIADVFTRREERSAVRVAVEVNGAWQTEVVAPIDEWVRFTATTTPGTAEVAFIAWWQTPPPPSDKPPPLRKVCIAMEARQ
jgi:hypothetical protein